ncbi:uncharacterized protein E0L32_003236 [Thyridium curvatum]|uniref:Uncharacterized protein n=1 Tax=Thyridium curvatum TaxID=1093900 RepID=A0A507BK78_9PEZI|nr:uncharacterized protein E0L32_003236 [Thyridium curvatum]TPX17118.1 hypothetical protein E0L32_003236 [Thyridium curvatum]
MAENPAGPPEDMPAPPAASQPEHGLDPSRYHLYTNLRGDTLYVHDRFTDWLDDLPQTLTPAERYLLGIDPLADHPLHPLPALSPRERFMTHFPIDTPLRVASAPVALPSSQNVAHFNNGPSTDVPVDGGPQLTLTQPETANSLASRKRPTDEDLQDAEPPRKRSRLQEVKAKVSLRFSTAFSTANGNANSKARAAKNDSSLPCLAVTAAATGVASPGETPAASQGVQGMQGGQGVPGMQGAQELQGMQGFQSVQGMSGVQVLPGLPGVPQEEDKFMKRMSRILSAATPSVMPSLRSPVSVALPDCLVRIIFMGDASVGKTTLIKRFSNSRFDQTYTPTHLETAFTTITRDNETVGLELWEAGGTVEPTRTSAMNFAWFDVVVICFSVGDSGTIQNLKEYYNHAMLRTEGACIVLAGLKKDLRREYGTLRLSFLEEPDAVSYHEGQRKAQEVHAQDFVECSAATGENVNELFEKVIALGVQRKKAIEKEAARLHREAKMEQRVSQVGKLAGRLFCFGKS